MNSLVSRGCNSGAATFASLDGVDSLCVSAGLNEFSKVSKFVFGRLLFSSTSFRSFHASRLASSENCANISASSVVSLWSSLTVSVFRLVRNLFCFADFFFTHFGKSVFLLRVSPSVVICHMAGAALPAGAATPPDL